VAKTTEDLFDDIFDANIRGVYFTVQKAPPLLADGGAVVLATSWFVEASVARSSTISASKAARLNLTRTLASELIGRNIRVNAVSAGTIETSLFGKLGPSGECADNRPVPAAHRSLHGYVWSTERRKMDGPDVLPTLKGCKEFLRLSDARLGIASGDASWRVDSRLVPHGDGSKQRLGWATRSRSVLAHHSRFQSYRLHQDQRAVNACLSRRFAGISSSQGSYLHQP
jgi:NAD(P)-dependent dehydrogenase (short-subunit alcohol dehydrogenase family)